MKHLGVQHAQALALCTLVCFSVGGWGSMVFGQTINSGPALCFNGTCLVWGCDHFVPMSSDTSQLSFLVIYRVKSLDHVLLPKAEANTVKP